MLLHLTGKTLRADASSALRFLESWDIRNDQIGLSGFSWCKITVKVHCVVLVNPMRFYSLISYFPPIFQRVADESRVIKLIWMISVIFTCFCSAEVKAWQFVHVSTKMPDFVIIKYNALIKCLSLSKTKSQILMLWCRYSQFLFLQFVFLILVV